MAPDRPSREFSKHDNVPSQMKEDIDKDASAVITLPVLFVHRLVGRR